MAVSVMIATTPSSSNDNQNDTDKHVMMKNEDNVGLNREGNDDENDAFKDNENGASDADNSMNGANGEGYSNKMNGDNGGGNRNAVTPDEVSTMDIDENDNIKLEDGGAPSSTKITNNNISGEIKSENKTNTGDDKNNSNTAPVMVAPVPLLKGILTYIDNELTRKHTITGMWNFESSTESHPQTFQLSRNLGPDEDPKELPKDGEFQGSFKVSYTSVGSNGKTKSRTRVIPETGVKLAFTKQEDEEDSFDIKGKGTNQYGVFSIYGTAVRDELEKDKAYRVELRKKYIATPDSGSSNMPLLSAKKAKSKNKKRKLTTTTAPAEKHDGPLPDPSESYPSGVVSLRGKVTRDSSVQDGVVHNIAGLWSTGLDLILSDPKNDHGFCNHFEYEHRSTVDTDIFPISGRYTGWFNYTEEGKKTRYTERDVVLKFRKNNAGYYNVEGRGINIFGKYNITGTLDKENIITLFRHFTPFKVKKTDQPSTAIGPSQHDGQQSKSTRMSLDDVEVPEQASYEPIVAPADGQYQAISRGILKLNEDGSHTCSGKWALSRSHHNTNATSNFNFGLEEHHAKQAIEDMEKNGMMDDTAKFPLDSPHYKGSFKMKKGTAKLQPVIDQQIVMKFRKNTVGSYNVYGKGVNIYGTFDLLGTFVLRGPQSGNVELFRIYPPVPEDVPTSASSSGHAKAKMLPLAKNAPSKKKSTESISSGPGHGLVRRESSRQSKLPSHLADDDPEAQKARLMDKCMGILKVIKEKDSNGGRYFLEPVDPVAHGIPTYHEIITNPMDLGTITTKMEANEIDSPEEFARLMRLVFENALEFNSNPMNYVHQSARNLLSIFNQKFRDVDRLVQKRKPSKTELKEMKKKQQKEEKKRLDKEKKRKREEEENPKLKHLYLLQDSAKDLNNSLEALSSASFGQSTQVSKIEFNILSDAMRQMNTQLQHISVLLNHLILPETLSTSNAGLASSNALYLEPSETSSNKKAKRSKKQPKAQIKEESSIEVEPLYVEPALVVPIDSHDPAPLQDEEPLTHEEQEELTSAINEMAEDNDKIMKVIEIIKKSKKSSELIDDDQEIELDLDQLDTATQRKLLRFAKKNKPKPKRKKNPKKKSATPPPTPMERQPVVNEQPVSETKAKSDESTFKFGVYDSDSDEEDVPVQPQAKREETSGFQEKSPIGEDDDESDVDVNEVPDWANISKQPEPDSKEEHSADDEDDAWEAAKGETAAQTQLDKERQEREEKLLREQKIAKEKSLAEAAEKNRKMQEERKAKEEEDARKREQKEKEEKEKAQQAKETMMKAVLNTEATVDLGEQQRIMGGIMSEYEKSIYDNDLAGGASPSSDFGF